jgi:hypothetical protein
MTTLLAIQLPQWLIDIWGAYKDVIIPALVTLAVALLTWVALKIKTDAKVNQAKAELQIQELKKINAREDTRPELDVMKQELQRLEQSNRYLGEMFDLVFQNSTLNQETKDSLAILKNKMVFGVEDNLVRQLTEEKSKLEEKIAALEKVITDASTVKATKETRTRR